MNSLFSVNRIAFSVLGYQLSYIELFGTVLTLWSVWLVAKRRIWTWPVGMVSVVLYMLLFYQIRLYSDALEQVYYLGASVYGWYAWTRSPTADGRILNVEFSSTRWLIGWVLITLVLGFVLGAFMSNADNLFPRIFPEPASYPYLDALTTIMSFTAMWLLARRRIESWIYWIVVDVIAVGLYYAKAVKFVALLYVILLFLASKGLLSWMKTRSVGKDRDAVMYAG
jgi:nicotinamide mononucleotide transporter